MEFILTEPKTSQLLRTQIESTLKWFFKISVALSENIQVIIWDIKDYILLELPAVTPVTQSLPHA